jgi:hypothetical protein
MIILLLIPITGHCKYEDSATASPIARQPHRLFQFRPPQFVQHLHQSGP